MDTEPEVTLATSDLVSPAQLVEARESLHKALDVFLPGSSTYANPGGGSLDKSAPKKASRKTRRREREAEEVEAATELQSQVQSADALESELVHTFPLNAAAPVFNSHVQAQPAYGQEYIALSQLLSLPRFAPIAVPASASPAITVGPCVRDDLHAVNDTLKKEYLELQADNAALKNQLLELTASAQTKDLALQDLHEASLEARASLEASNATLKDELLEYTSNAEASNATLKDELREYTSSASTKDFVHHDVHEASVTNAAKLSEEVVNLKAALNETTAEKDAAHRNFAELTSLQSTFQRNSHAELQATIRNSEISVRRAEVQKKVAEQKEILAQAAASSYEDKLAASEKREELLQSEINNMKVRLRELIC